MHARDHLGKLRPRSVAESPAIVETMLLACKAKGLSRKYMIHILGEVKGITKTARKLGLVSESKLDLVEVPRVDRTKKKRVQLTDAEFVRYVSHPDTLDFSLVENEQRKKRGEVQLVSRQIKTMSIIGACLRIELMDVGPVRAIDEVPEHLESSGAARVRIRAHGPALGRGAVFWNTKHEAAAQRGDIFNYLALVQLACARLWLEN